MLLKLLYGTSISAPARTKTLQWTICLAGCSVTDSNQAWNYETTIDMPYNSKELPAQQIELPFKASRKSITVVAIRLSYVAEKRGKLGKVEDKGWLPCGVVGMKVN